VMRAIIVSVTPCHSGLSACVCMCACVWSVEIENVWTVDVIVIATALVCTAAVATAIAVIVLWLYRRKMHAADPTKSKESALLVPPQSNESLIDMIDGTGSGSGWAIQLLIICNSFLPKSERPKAGQSSLL